MKKNSHAMVDCKAMYHPKCISISDADITAKRIDESLSKWVCGNCLMANSSNSSISLSDIAKMLNNIAEENSTLKRSVSEIHTKLDAQTAQITALVAKIQSLEEENIELRRENGNLKLEMDDLEQYSRRNCLEIHGIPESQGENILI